MTRLKGKITKLGILLLENTKGKGYDEGTRIHVHRYGGESACEEEKKVNAYTNKNQDRRAWQSLGTLVFFCWV